MHRLRKKCFIRANRRFLLLLTYVSLPALPIPLNGTPTQKSIPTNLPLQAPALDSNHAPEEPAEHVSFPALVTTRAPHIHIHYVSRRIQICNCTEQAILICYQRPDAGFRGSNCLVPEQKVLNPNDTRYCTILKSNNLSLCQASGNSKTTPTLFAITTDNASVYIQKSPLGTLIASLTPPKEGPPVCS